MFLYNAEGRCCAELVERGKEVLRLQPFGAKKKVRGALHVLSKGKSGVAKCSQAFPTFITCVPC